MKVISYQSLFFVPMAAASLSTAAFPQVEQGGVSSPPRPDANVTARAAATTGKSQFAASSLPQIGWVIQQPQPPQPKPNRAAAFLEGDDGNESTFAAFRTLAPDIQPQARGQRPRPVLTGDDGIVAPTTAAAPITWSHESPQTYRRARPILSALFGRSEFASFQLSPMGWEVLPFQPNHPRPEKAGAVLLGDPGTQAKFVPPVAISWALDTTDVPALRRSKQFATGDEGTQARLIAPPPGGWWVAPPMLLHPRPERAGAIMLGDAGIADRARRWVNGGWEIAPPQPNHPRPERAGAIAFGEPGTEAIFSGVPPVASQWGHEPPLTWKPVRPKGSAIFGRSQFAAFNLTAMGWEIAGVQPPHPRPERSASLAGARNVESPAVAPLVLSQWGHEPQFFAAPKRNRGSAAGGRSQFAIPIREFGAFVPEMPSLAYRRPQRISATKGRTMFAIFAPFVPSGFDLQPIQPPHRFYNGGVLRGNDGIEARYVVRAVAWGYEAPPVYSRIATGKRGAGMRGPDGIERPFSRWFNTGWEVTPVQPPRARWEKSGALARGADGIEQVRINYFPVYPVVDFQVPHPRRERAGALMRGDDGNANVYSFVVTPITWWEIQPLQPRQAREKRGAIVRGDDGNQGTLTPFFAYGWFVQATQPPHPRPERAGASLVGDSGTAAPFLPPNFVASAWGHAFEPTTARRVTRTLADRDDGIAAPFRAPATYGWFAEPVQVRHPRPERQGAIASSSFVDAPLAVASISVGWFFDPNQLRKAPEKRGAIALGDTGVQARFTYWTNVGWEIASPQPPHRGNEHRYASLVGGDPGQQQRLLGWLNVGWEFVTSTPKHPRTERGGTLFGGDVGIYAKYHARRRIRPKPHLLGREAPTDLVGRQVTPSLRADKDDVELLGKVDE